MKSIIVFLLVVMALMLCVNISQADTCRHTTTVGVSYGSGYNNGVVVQQQLYHNGNYNAYGTLLVPKAFLAYVNEFRPTYLGISDDYRQREFAKQVAEEYFKLSGAAGGGGQANAGTPQRKSRIEAILAARCVSCHGQSGSEPYLDGDPELIPKVVRLESFAAVTRNEMPKKGEALPQAEFDEVGLWAKRAPQGPQPNAGFKQKQPQPEVPSLPEVPAIENKAKAVPPKKVAIPKAKE